MRAGNHEHVVALGELPCQHDLLVAHAVGRRDLAERVELGLIIGVTVAAERAPAHEGQANLGAVVERVLGLQVNRRVLVLHGHELVAQNAARNVDLLDGGVGDTGLLRHALVHQLLDGFDGLVVRHLRIGAVEVQQVNGVHAERQCALLAATNQVLRATVHIPRGAAVGEVAEVAHLGGHQHLVLRPFQGPRAPAFHRSVLRRRSSSKPKRCRCGGSRRPARHAGFRCRPRGRDCFRWSAAFRRGRWRWWRTVRGYGTMPW